MQLLFSLLDLRIRHNWTPLKHPWLTIAHPIWSATSPIRHSIVTLENEISMRNFNGLGLLAFASFWKSKESLYPLVIVGRVYWIDILVITGIQLYVSPENQDCKQIASISYTPFHSCSFIFIFSFYSLSPCPSVFKWRVRKTANIWSHKNKHQLVPEVRHVFTLHLTQNRQSRLKHTSENANSNQNSTILYSQSHDCGFIMTIPKCCKCCTKLWVPRHSRSHSFISGLWTKWPKFAYGVTW